MPVLKNVMRKVHIIDNNVVFLLSKIKESNVHSRSKFSMISFQRQKYDLRSLGPK